MGFPVFAGSVPDTGQTQSYTDTFGEDSDYTINPPSYTKLDSNGNSLPVSVSSWAMVKDNVTGLIWEVKTDDETIHDKDNTYTWQDAQDVFIAALNSSAGFGGYTDWRLPTIKELAYIVDYSIPSPGPCINTTYFSNTRSAGYWLSTMYAYVASGAWGISFHYGLGSWDYKSNYGYVRVVRGGQGGALGNLAMPWIPILLLQDNQYKKIGIFRDQDCTQVLDDWPTAGGQLRSPKYIFGKEDNIYIRVNGPAGKGNSYYYIELKSESDTLAVGKFLEETSSGVYRYNHNLRLADATVEGINSDTVKVVDEEVLTFTLYEDWNLIDTKTVMVDRGEYATAAARYYDSLILGQPYGPDNRTPFWNANADEFASDIDNWPFGGNLDWWEAGQVRGSLAGNNDAFDSFIKNAGGNIANHLETDFFYSNSHGNNSGNLYGTEPDSANLGFEKEELIIDAYFEVDKIWCNDVDWALVKACSILNHLGPGRDYWEYALKTERRAHGILSFEGISRSIYDAYIDDFFDEIGARHSIITSWVNANSALLTIDQPYAIVYHTENGNDYFRKPEEGISLTADVTTDNFSYLWRDEVGTTGTDKIDAESTSIQTFSMNINNRPRLVTTNVYHQKEKIRSVRAEAFRFSEKAFKKSFDSVRVWTSEKMVSSSNINLSSVGFEFNKALSIASEFMKEHCCPKDATIETYTPIKIEGPDGSLRTIAYEIVYVHKINEIAVAGDKIKMVVQAEGVKLFSTYWHVVKSDLTDAGTSLKAFDNKVMSEGINWIQRYTNIGEDIPKSAYVQPAYYVGDINSGGRSSGQARLVWDIVFENGVHAYYDPKSGKAIDYFSHSRKQRSQRKK